MLASKLSIDHTMEKIWIPSFESRNDTNKEGSRSDVSALRWLTVTVNSAPRLVEMMGAASKKEFGHSWSNSANDKSWSLALHAVLEDFDRQIEESVLLGYAFKYLHALFNGQCIVMDDAVLHYVRKSVFANSISSFSNDKEDSEDLVPELACCCKAGGGG